MNVYGFKKYFKDLTGQKFNKWTVVKLYGKTKHDKLWKCRCECGSEHVVTQYNLTHGRSKGCTKCAGKERIQNKIDIKKLFDKVISSLKLLEENGFAVEDIIARVKEKRNEFVERQERDKES